MKNTPFDFTLKHGNDRTLRLKGHVTPYSPAVMYLSNGDPGYPEDGGEIEDLEIFLVHKRKDGKLVEKYLEAPDGSKLAESLYDSIYEHIADLCGWED